MSQTRPPALARVMLQCIVPVAIREAVLGDLEEEFREIARKTGGRWAARWWYWRQAISALFTNWPRRPAVTSPAWPTWLKRLPAMDSLLRARSGPTPARYRPTTQGTRMAIFPELRLAARRLLRQRGFTIASILTLGVGIGANVAMFAVLHGVVLNPLPFPDSDRLVQLDHSAPGIGTVGGLEMTSGLYVHYSELSRTIDRLAIYTEADVTVTGHGQPQRLRAVVATHELSDVLRMPPLLGRFFRESDNDGGGTVAVLSHATWSAMFGADSSVVGRSITIDGVAFDIVGVMPPRFDFPSRDTQLWAPFVINPATTRFGSFTLSGVARVASGMDAAAVEQELQGLIPGLVDRFPGTGQQMVHDAQLTSIVTPLKRSMIAEVEATLWILLATVGIVLLIAATNVVNLLVVRAAGRQREVAVRTALGAASVRITSYYMAEAVWLSIGGGLVGLGLAWAGVWLIRRLGPDELPRLHEIGLTPTVLVVAFGLTVVMGVLSGAIPLTRRRPDLVDALKQGGRTSVGRGALRSRHALVVTQTAFALILIVGAGLMARSFWHMSNVDVGFERDGVLTFQLGLPFTNYQSRESSVALHAQVLERLRAIPGVESVGATTCLPLCRSWAGNAWAREDQPVPEGEIPPILATRRISDDYFETMRILVHRGRTIDRLDYEQRTGAAVINAAAATKLFPGDDPIGKRLYHQARPDAPEWYTVVGVVANAPVTTLTDDRAPIVYLPLLHRDSTGGLNPRALEYAIRASLPPTNLMNAVRRVVLDLDDSLPLARVRSLDRIVSQAASGMAFTMVMLVISAAMALFLGIVGVYSVIAYIVSQRTAEFGLRLAIGARAHDVVTMVLRQGGAMVGAGVIVGLAGALLLTRFMRAMLFGITATDPLTYVVVTTVLVAIALLAIYAPARRAASVDPMESLRVD